MINNRKQEERKSSKKQIIPVVLVESNLNDTKTLIINETVKIIEHAHKVFVKIRQIDGIDQKHICESLSPDFNRKQVFKAGESQGKSGSFFFFSHDKQFLLKTMTNRELEEFVKMLPKYIDHLSEHPESLLARIYGVFTVRMEDIVPIHIILMGNTCQYNNAQNIENVFDLKGSLVNRKYKGKDYKSTQTLKDLNLIKKCKQKIVRF